MAKKARTPAPPRKVQAPQVRKSTRPSTGAGRNRNLLVGGAAVVVLAVVGIVLGLVFAGGSSSSTSSFKVDWAALGPLHKGPPPWDNGATLLQQRVAPLGLTQMASEGVVRHDHQHLDLYVNGKHVTVPPDIGIDPAGQWITEVHSHDARGVIHVESPKKKDFYLGQFFGEWGVKLTSSCVANFCGHVQWWVNGKKMTGDPADLTLKAHQEIVVAAGKPPFVVPKSFKFQQGE